MKVATLTDFKQNMHSYFERVLSKGEPLYISQTKGTEVVLLSKKEYDSMKETFHLLRSPKNAERLLKAIESDKSEGGQVQKLLD